MGISTPRSPLATIIPSAAFMISSRFRTPSRFSIFAMICELVLRIGQEGFVKYIGFNIIMIIIGITGLLMKKNYKLYKKIHIIFTALFFVYLPIAIKFM